MDQMRPLCSQQLGYIEKGQNSEIRKIFSEKRKSDCTMELWSAVMPNQKQRKKKQGSNKSKKVQAMRAKEALAKPADKPTATGKRPGQTSKFEILQYRPGAFRRA